MDLGVVLSKTDGREQTATCYCLPECNLNTRKRVISFFPNVRFQNISSDMLASKVAQSLNEWDTFALSPLEIKQERHLWKHFFCSERLNVLGLRRLDFFRTDSEKKYSIIVSGNKSGKLSDIFSKIYFSYDTSTEELPETSCEEDLQKNEMDFALQKKELIIYGKPLKQRVSVSESKRLLWSRKHKKTTTVINVESTYASFITNSAEECAPFHINQTFLYQFAHTPTIKRIDLFLNTQNERVQLTFSTES